MLNMASDNIQFNARISDELAKKVKKEAIEHGVDLGDIASKAFEKFLALPVSQRRFILEKCRKVSGRKIKNVEKNFAPTYGAKPPKGANA